MKEIVKAISHEMSNTLYSFVMDRPGGQAS